MTWARKCSASVAGVRVGAAVAPQDVVGQVEPVALADQDTQRPVALARRRGRSLEPPAHELESRLELVVVAAFAQRRLDRLARDAERVQAALDALRAPSVQ